MTFSGAATNAQIDDSLSSIMLLNSSCQAVIEAEIQEVASPWYQQLDQELGAAENLVLGWRQSGVLYFQSDILGAISANGTAFLAAQGQIDGMFASLARNFDPAVKAQLIAAMQALEPPLQGIIGQIGAYLTRLQAFEEQMGTAQTAMQTTVAQVQAQEQEIQSEIAGINAQIAALNTQIQTDRDAISKARSARTTGIVETIFGVIFAPVTGGASLILAGIGVASIAEAQSKIDAMESTISGYQQTIANDQTNLSNDQTVVATLGALTMSTGIVLGDIAGIESALDALRTSWTMFDGELDGTIQKLDAATDAPALVVSQAWYDAACTEWNLVVQHVGDITNAGTTTNRVQVG